MSKKSTVEGTLKAAEIICKNLKESINSPSNDRTISPDYKDHLIALCEGLEIQGIGDLLNKTPEHFRVLGETMASIFKDARAKMGT